VSAQRDNRAGSDYPKIAAKFAVDAAAIAAADAF
jgi:hypothetical protein